MFRNRETPPTTSDKEKELLELVAGGVNLKYSIFDKKIPGSVVRRAIAREILGQVGTRLYVPEYMLVNTKRRWNDLSDVEADYFAAKLLGLDVVIEPIVDGLLKSPLVCVNKSTGSWICPTADWDLAHRLASERRVSAKRVKPRLCQAETTTHTLTHRSMCLAMVFVALAREEPYDIDYKNATAGGGS
jgi:hypothetical protein